MVKKLKPLIVLITFLTVAAAGSTRLINQALAQTKIKIGTLGVPSTSVWMVAVMQAKRFDLKRGVDIDWVEQPSTAAVYNDFAAGSYPVATGGVMSYANQYARGVKAKFCHLPDLRHFGQSYGSLAT